MNIVNELSEKMILKLRKNSIIERYNILYSTDILEKINYYDSISEFSTGVLFLLLKNKTKFLKNEMELAEVIQLIFLSTDLIDDYFDQDNNKVSFISDNNLILLSTELLIYSISKLCTVRQFSDSFFYLQKAFEGEFFDINTDVTNDTNTVEIYYEKIMNKSSCLFKFLFSLSSTKTEFDQVWNTFCEKYALFLQITNDIYGILGKSSDVDLKRSTLPILLYLNIDSTSILSVEEIKKSGVIEYCIFIRENLKRECKKILFDNKIDAEIITYLNLGEDILV